MNSVAKNTDDEAEDTKSFLLPRHQGEIRHKNGM